MNTDDIDWDELPRSIHLRTAEEQEEILAANPYILEAATKVSMKAVRHAMIRGASIYGNSWVSDAYPYLVYLQIKIRYDTDFSSYPYDITPMESWWAL